MNKCLEIINLVTNISRYLSFESIVALSLCNKYLYYNALNPERNIVINNLYMQNIFHEFFEFDKDDDYNFLNNKNLSDKIFLAKVNWKNVLKEMWINFKNYKDKKIVEKVRDCFRIHMYLPDLRKENAHLEYEASSSHQMISYDIIFRSACTYNFYSKSITKEYLLTGFQTEDNKYDNKDNNNNKDENSVKILKEGLSFQNELSNYKKTFIDIMKNDYYKDLIFNYFIKYKYEDINNLYINKYDEKSSNNGFFDLLLWVNHSFILYSDFVYKYLNTIKDDVDEKTFLIEYKRKYDELINCGLLLNSYFDNINIIINQFMVNYPLFSHMADNKKLELSLTSSTSSTSTTSSESSVKSGANIDNLEDLDFSIYNLFMTTIKNNVYNKLFNCVTNKFEILVKQYFTKTFEEFKENEIEEDSNKDEEISDCDYMKNELNNNIEDNDNMDIEDDDDYMNDNISQKEQPEKEIIEAFINSQVDLTINGKNANAINHTGLIVTKQYEYIEDILINRFTDTLNNNIKQEKPLNILFEIIKKITKCSCNQIGLIRSSSSLTLIRRTKKQLMKKSISILFKKIIECLPKNFIDHIKINDRKERILSVSDFEIKNNIEFSYNLDDLSSKKKIDVREKAEKEIENVKTYLSEKIIKPYEEENIKNQYGKLINDYIDFDGIELVLLIKKLIWFYYNELAIYEEKDEKVSNILKRKCSKTHNNEENKPFMDNSKKLREENLFMSDSSF